MANDEFYRQLRDRVSSYSGPYAEYVLLLPDLFVLLSRLMLDSRIEGRHKAMLGGALAYFVLAHRPAAGADVRPDRLPRRPGHPRRRPQPGAQRGGPADRRRPLARQGRPALHRPPQRRAGRPDDRERTPGLHPRKTRDEGPSPRTGVTGARIMARAPRIRPGRPPGARRTCAVRGVGLPDGDAIRGGRSTAPPGRPPRSRRDTPRRTRVPRRA